MYLMNDHDRELYETQDLIYTIIFSIDVVIQFFVEKSDTTSIEVQRNFFKVALIYIKSSFIFDVIAIFPFYHFFKNSFKFCRLMYFIKLIRLYRGLQLLNIRVFMNHIKQFTYSRLEKIIDENPDLANSKTQDSAHIIKIMLTSYIVSTLKLIIISSSMSYFIGMFWYIYCDTRLKWNSEQISQDE